MRYGELRGGLLRLPGTLVAAALTSQGWGCNPPATNDGGAEGGAEGGADASDASTDLGPAEGGMDVLLDVAGEACTPTFGMGFQCLFSRSSPPDAGCTGTIVCAPSECPSACPACPVNPANGEYGVTCTAALDAGPGTVCPSRVCVAADCPAGCRACDNALFCIPDTLPDGGRAVCPGGIVCAATECPPGCRAVG